MSKGDEIDKAAIEFAAAILIEAEAIGKKYGRDQVSVAKEIALAVKRALPKPASTGLQNRQHGRIMPYLVRVQLIAPNDEGVIADSDPELPIDDPGTETVLGLAAVADLAGYMATEFHRTLGESVSWPSGAEIERRIKTVRVILSRGHGRARWRIKYGVNGQEFTAFILVVRKPNL